MDSALARREPPRWFWLFAPFAIFPMQIAARVAGDEAYVKWMRGEISVPELGTLAFLLVAAGFGVALWLKRREFASRRFGIWIVLFTLGCLLWAGEETSWGQHYGHWKSPEFFVEHNQQGETGLHNLETVRPLVDNFPRLVLTLGAMFAVLVPLLARWKPQRFGAASHLAAFLPTHVCVPAALLALLVRNIEKLAIWIGQPWRNWFDLQAGEFKEYFLAYLLMVYAASLWWRTRSAPAVTPG